MRNRKVEYAITQELKPLIMIGGVTAMRQSLA
jgi:hypothetical protein